MSYFSGLAASAFKDNPNGEGWLFYPYGILGKGRLVTDKRHKDKLFRFQKRMYMFVIPLGVFYGMILDLGDISLFDAILPVSLITGIYLRQRHLVKDLPVSDVRLKHKEAISKAVRGLPGWYAVVLQALSILMIAMALGAPVIFGMPYSDLTPIFSIMFGLGLLGFLLGIYIKRLRNSEE